VLGSTAVGSGSFASSFPAGGGSKTLDLPPAISIIGGGSISSDTDTGVFGRAASDISTEGSLTSGGRNTPSTAAEAIHGSQRSTITAAGSVRGAADAAVPASEIGAQRCGGCWGHSCVTRERFLVRGPS
jgi:hypothetical protein